MSRKLTESKVAQKIAEEMVNSLKNATQIYDMAIIEYYMRKAISKGRENDKSKSKKHSTKKVAVIQLDSLDNEIDNFESYANAEAMTGIKKEAICMVCNGKRNLAGGYKWKYDEKKINN